MFEIIFRAEKIIVILDIEECSEGIHLRSGGKQICTDNAYFICVCVLCINKLFTYYIIISSKGHDEEMQ